MSLVKELTILAQLANSMSHLALSANLVSNLAKVAQVYTLVKNVLPNNLLSLRQDLA